MSDPPRVLGRYTLHRPIASGGMATVHVGRLLGPIGFARTVAIKRLHASYARDPAFVAMFVDEARLAARIHHPNVVSTLDVVTMEEELFVVMEYVHGDALAHLLTTAQQTKKRVPLGVAVAIAAGILEGLHAAHEAKSEGGEPLSIVHRDVSPQNVLVGVDGVPRVIDFGVAKAADRLQTTREGQLKGKLAYMAREQLERGVVDRRTDVYAASVVAWEILTQRRLFRAQSEGQLVTQVLVGATDPPSAFVDGVPRELDRVIMRGLASDAAQRWPTAREMALALEDVVPAARPRDVGAWVEEIARDVLRTRSQLVTELESGDTLISDEPTVVTPPTTEHTSMSATTAAEHASATGRARRRIVPWSLAVLGVLSLLAVGARWALEVEVRAPSVSTHDALSASTAPPSASTPPPSLASAPTEPPTAASSSKPTPPPQPTATKLKSTAKPAAPRPSCDPPYVVDAQGVHRFKRECLGAAK